MDKSQLRKLAAEYADGLVPAGEYRARRRELIDAIVAGSQPVERDPPPAPSAAPTSVAGAKAAARPAVVPWHLVLAGASVVCIVVVVALLWPSKDQPVPPSPPAALIPAPEVSPARTLVESFLARRDFSEGAVNGFQRDWAALDPAQREEARSALWFSSLVRAMRDELKTQKALAGLAGGEAALDRAKRIVALGGQLGVSDRLPDLGDLAPPAAGSAAAPEATPAPPPAVAPAPSRTETADTASLTGRQWLAGRADGELTLQLFAVNKLDRVEQLMSAHPSLTVHILATDGATPRYRVFHGVFADERAARNAFDALPEEVTSAAGGAIVKSFAVVREDLADRGSSSETAAAAPGGLVRAAPGAASPYTLQLFASPSRANAESLVDAFPALSLQLRELAGDAAPYRVVYGRFDSAAAARAAEQALPPDLLSRIGRPLPKPVDRTGTPVAR